MPATYRQRADSRALSVGPRILGMIAVGPALRLRAPADGSRSGRSTRWHAAISRLRPSDRHAASSCRKPKEIENVRARTRTHTRMAGHGVRRGRFDRSTRAGARAMEAGEHGRSRRADDVANKAKFTRS